MPEEPVAPRLAIPDLVSFTTFPRAGAQKDVFEVFGKPGNLHAGKLGLQRSASMAVIAVIQQKGGVGKSTITANVAGELVRKGRMVKILDLDPQQSLVIWAQLGSGVLRDIVEPVSIEGPKEFKATLDRVKKEADRIFLDCPPGLPDIGLVAALVSDVALLPVTPSPLDVIASKKVLDLLREAQAQRRDKKPIMAFVTSRVMQNTVLGRDFGTSLKPLGEAILPGISQRIAIAEAVLQGLTLREYAPGSDGVEEFHQLANAIERMVRQL
jgi:chromosome partitioning protein